MPMPLLTAALLVSGVLQSLPSDGRLSRGGVVVELQQAALLGDTLELSAKVRSHINVDVLGVEVGVLYGPNPAALQAANVDVLYDRPDGWHTDAGVGTARHRAALTVTAVEERTARLTVSVAKPPVHVVTHVLGYTLADLTPTLAGDLLGSNVAADERAVVDAFALLGSPRERYLARRAWAAQPARVDAFARLIARAPPLRPTTAQTKLWLVTLLGLGQVGDEAALAQIRAWHERPGPLASLHDGLQVVLLARLSGPPLASPLAHALPVRVRRPQDVVAAALELAAVPAVARGGP